MNISITKTTTPRQKPDEKNLGFGKYMTDHMFTMDYDAEHGWHNAQIIPYGKIEVDPAAVVLHYAQETFEGLKAYRTSDDRILLFRPEMNAKRMQNSNRRLCIPEIPVEDFVEAVKALVKVEADWVPREPGTSLYIRPFVFSTDCQIGLHTSFVFKFVIVCSPVGAYYAAGVNPVKILVEEEFVRAVQGGTGFAKCGGNYASSMLAQAKAEEKGYSQVLWLDGHERKYVEEVGSMNIMFKINGEIYTAPIDGTVLPGVTRDSIIHILKDWGYTVHEQRVAIDDLMKAGQDGSLEEAFGTGTAAVISPVGLLDYKGTQVTINHFENGELTMKLYNYLTGIQWGREKDPYGWATEVK